MSIARDISWLNGQFCHRATCMLVSSNLHLPWIREEHWKLIYIELHYGSKYLNRSQSSWCESYRAPRNLCVERPLGINQLPAGQGVLEISQPHSRYRGYGERRQERAMRVTGVTRFLRYRSPYSRIEKYRGYRTLAATNLSIHKIYVISDGGIEIHYYRDTLEMAKSGQHTSSMYTR